LTFLASDNNIAARLHSIISHAMLAKQAKLVNKPHLTRLLDHVSHSRYPERDRVIVLLSFKAGLRAKEIAGLTWSMVTDA
jgi:integrase/recombinase XerC